MSLIIFSKNFPTMTLHCAETNVYATVNELIDSNQTCDTSSNLKIAQDLLNRHLSDESLKSLNNWPIGFPALLAFFVYAEKLGLPIIFGFSILISILITYFLIQILKFAIHNKKVFIGLLFTLIFILTSPNEGWISGAGLLYPEGLAIISFCIAIFKIFKSEFNNNKLSYREIFTISFFLALSAYFRAIYELQINIITVSFICLTILIYALNYKFKVTRLINLNELNRLIVICCLTFIFMLPWRIMVNNYIQPGSFSWTNSYSKWWITWIPTPKLAEFNISLDSAQGGINLGCELNPKLCQQLNVDINFLNNPKSQEYDQQFLEKYVNSIISSPVKFMKIKGSMFRNFWLQDNEYNYLRNWNFTEGYFYALILFASILISFFNSKKFLLSTLVLNFSILLQLGILVLHHLEARYFIGIKITSLLLIFLCFFADNKLFNYFYRFLNNKRLEFLIK